MKRSLSLFLAALLIVALAGCSSGNGPAPTPTPEPSIEVTEGPTPTPEPTPSPTPEPTPLPAARDFTYMEVANATLAIAASIPDFWIASLAKRSICYEEPTERGTPARVAITCKVLAKKPDGKAMQNQMEKFLALIRDGYQDYSQFDANNKVKALGISNGYRMRYQGTSGDEAISGYVLMCYVESGRRLYLIHFSAPTARYAELDEVWNKIIASLHRPR